MIYTVNCNYIIIVFERYMDYLWVRDAASHTHTHTHKHTHIAVGCARACTRAVLQALDAMVVNTNLLLLVAHLLALLLLQPSRFRFP
jgi:hypothetical protein